MSPLEAGTVQATVHVNTTTPVGLATKAGLSGAVAQFTGALVLVTQDQTPEAVALLVSSGLTLLTVLGGRYAQAVAAVRVVAREVGDS